MPTQLTSVPMTEALPPEGCEIVREFLRALQHCRRQHEEVNISQFLSAYRETINGPRKRRRRRKTG